MLLLKADTEYDEKIRAAIGKLDSTEKSAFDAEVKRRLDKWTQDYIASKVGPLENIFYGQRIPDEFKDEYEKIKNEVEEQIKYPGISNLASSGEGVNLGDVTIDLYEGGELVPDIVSRTKLAKLWVEETKDADDKFPMPQKKIAEEFDKNNVLRDILVDAYTEEDISASARKPREGESEEDREIRLARHAFITREQESWKIYASKFGKEYPNYVERMIEEDSEEEQIENYSTVVIEDFEEKLSSLLENPKVYNAPKVKKRYESAVLAEMLVNSDKMKKLMEEITQKEFSPTEQETEKRRMRIEKDVFLTMTGRRVPGKGSMYDEMSYTERLEDFQRGVSREGWLGSVIGKWMNDTNLRDEFLRSRREKKEQVVLENELADYKQLLRELTDKERAKQLRRKGMRTRGGTGGIHVVANENEATTQIQKNITKTFGVKKVTIRIEDKDVIIDFSERAKTKQVGTSKIKRVLNIMSRPSKAGKTKSAIKAYEEIPTQVRKMLRLFLFKGVNLDADYSDVVDLFLTEGSKWVGGEWTEPKMNDNNESNVDAMSVVMERAGEDKVRPPKKISEMDVGRRRRQFISSEKGATLGDFKLEDRIEQLGSPRELTPSALRELLVYSEDALEDEIKDDNSPQTKVLLETIAKVLAYIEIQGKRPPKNDSIYQRIDDLDKLIEKLKESLTKSKKDIEDVRVEGDNLPQELRGQLSQDTEQASTERRKIMDEIRVLRVRTVNQFRDEVKEIEDYKFEIKPIYKGSLKRDIERHATKAKFDLDNEVERLREEIEEKYDGLYLNSLIKEKNDILTETLEEYDTFIEDNAN